MSETKQDDAPPKRCGVILDNNNPCARAVGHPGFCVIQDGWCDRHSAYTHQIPRDDGKPNLYVCVPCLQESQQQLRIDDAGIREGIAATRRELVSMITGKFAQVDTHIEATHLRIDALRGVHVQDVQRHAKRPSRRARHAAAELRQMFAYRRAEKTWQERAREFIGLQLRELAFRLDGQP